MQTISAIIRAMPGEDKVMLDALLAVAGRLDRTPAQVALRWLLQKPAVTSPIVGARTMEQLEGHLGALGWKLPEDAMRELDAASELPLPYPYDFVRNGMLSREDRG